MKTITLFFSMFLTFLSFGTEIKELPITKVVRYEHHAQEALELPVDFAASNFLKPEVIKQLKGKRIHHVDLVYTSFRLSPDFDQKMLNQSRIEKLKRALPRVVSDYPSWNLIEQEGAKTVSEAHAYYHGFVLYFSDDLNYSDLSSFLKPFQNDFKLFTVNNELEQHLSHGATQIHIPEGAVVDAEGRSVKGNYDLQYREFRNPAEIALSGIPMIYHSEGEEYRFNSAGMFEIRAEQNGKELFLKKDITMDFNTTQQIPGVAYYQLDEENGEWIKERELSESENKQTTRESGRIEVAEDVLKLENGMPVILPNKASEKLYSWCIRTNSMNSNLEFEFNKNAWRCVRGALINQEDLRDKLISIRSKNRIIICKKKDSLELEILIDKAFDNCYLANERTNKPQTVINDNNALFESSQAGHIFPEIVTGLVVSGFGVYNCDQQYRIQEPVILQASFTDAKTKAPIEDAYVACLIDLNVNGSFSFHPKHISCDPYGKNVLLLFTRDKKIYMVDEQAFLFATEIDKLQPSFAMKDVTAELKTTENLKQLLHLQIYRTAEGAGFEVSGPVF